ncbi:uncharacterized protein PRCAT00000921001 [Priceomyces carsonii]|uniref:uncharacterized protein n=1 Tax=Priceomyces carsonii TaxID=28549 RepID=UPI002EDB62AF|nr:unnamed protein product [Priceomyces carsonii]
MIIRAIGRRKYVSLKQLLSVRFFTAQSICRSTYSNDRRKTLRDIEQLYARKEPITMLTAYDSITSRVADNTGVDISLIGDSLAMTTLGMQDTIEITLDEFLFHVKSVERGNKRSLLIADLPFGSFESSKEQAIETAIKLVKFGKIQGIKIEGGNEETIPKIRGIINAGIPVMGHVGLTPQKHNSLGGFKLQGSQVNNALDIYKDCIRLQEAGCFSIVLECIPNKLAELITKKLSIPTIGIGAGPSCSGQVLVISDMLGMSDPNSHRPKFVKPYLNFYDQAVKAISEYKHEVSSGTFPDADEHGYKMKSEVLSELQKEIQKL